MNGATIVPSNHPEQVIAVLPACVQFREAGPAEDPRSRLLGRVEILGVDHHLEAFRVTERELPSLVVEEPTFGEQICDGPEEVAGLFEDYYHASGAEGAWSTVEIQGKPYVLVMIPSSQ